MEDKKNELPGGQLDDEDLDAASGGVARRELKQACKRCETEVPISSLTGGYCRTCVVELTRQGFQILI